MRFFDGKNRNFTNIKIYHNSSKGNKTFDFTYFQFTLNLRFSRKKYLSNDALGYTVIIARLVKKKPALGYFYIKINKKCSFHCVSLCYFSNFLCNLSIPVKGIKKLFKKKYFTDILVSPTYSVYFMLLFFPILFRSSGNWYISLEKTRFFNKIVWPHLRTPLCDLNQQKCN